MRRVLLLVAVAVLTAPTVAHGAGWSRPWGHSAGTEDYAEPAPRVAVASDGTSVATFGIDFGLNVVTGDARGRFSRPRNLGSSVSTVAAVAAAPGGRALVAWERRDGLYVSVRGRSGRPFRTRRLAPSTGAAINDVAAKADPRGGWFVTESQWNDKRKKTYLRAFTLRADGSLALTPQTLGEGEFGSDANPIRALAVDDRGYATAVFGSPAGPLVSQAVHAGHFGPVQALGKGLANTRVTASADGDGRALIAATDPANCGDAGCFGQPVAFRLDASARPVALAVPKLEHPQRAFEPSIAPLGTGRAALVFQLKSGPDPFGSLAPVRASVLRDDGPAGALQTLTSKPASEPIAGTLSGGRVLVFWSGERGLGAALAGPDGRFRTTAAPVGPPPEPYHTNPTNRELSTAGRYALVGWSRKARVRLSLRRF